MYPKLTDLIKLELETLDTINSISGFRKFEGLYNKTSTRSMNKNAKSLDWHADFILDVRLRGDRRDANCARWIHIGALLDGDVKTNEILRSSYSVVLFRRDNLNSPVVRKLHFDFEALSTRNANEAKPSSHIQMCGKASPHLLKQGFNAQRLSSHYPNFEQPRIPSMPTSLALIIDWLFTEFRTDRNALAIYNSKQWRNQVVAAERIVLKPYFQDAANHIGSAAHTDSPLIRKFMYGIT
ncbi:MAG: hypothetical protein ACOH2S_10945 [Janthinobacterium svalbardensis]